MWEREAADFWRKAVGALLTAEEIERHDYEGAANRAYYAAFYAVSALFSLSGITFKKHQAVQAAVHRDLVHAGRWTPAMGADYSKLFRLRLEGDYTSAKFVTAEEATTAVEIARRILHFINDMYPEIFSLKKD